MQSKHSRTVALLVALGFVATGCGGGGSKSSNNGSPVIPVVPGDNGGGGDTGGGEIAPPPPIYGEKSWSVFLDGTVSGVTYSSGDIEKKVVENGFVEHYENEPVSIYLGQTRLASMSGSRVLSPVEVKDASGATNPDYQANLAELLAAADDDGYINNGIQISAAVRAVVPEGLNLDVSYDDFITENQTVLDAIRNATASKAHAALGKAAASALMDTMETSINTAFAGLGGEYQIFTDTGRYFANIEFSGGGNGRVISYSSATPGNSGTPSYSDIDLWTVDVTGSKMTYAKPAIERECFALGKERVMIKAVCQDNIGKTPSYEYYLQSLKLGTGDAHFPNEAFTGKFNRYARLGSTLSGMNMGLDPAENLRRVPFWISLDGSAEYNGMVGNWTEAGPRPGSIEITDGVTTKALNFMDQIGPYALLLAVNDLDPGLPGVDTDGYQVAVDSGQVLRADDLTGSKFNRYHYYSGSEFPSVEFKEDGFATNDPAITYGVDAVTNQLMLNGAKYDKCSYLGAVVDSLMFYCNVSADTTVMSRLEWWVKQ